MPQEALRLGWAKIEVCRKDCEVRKFGSAKHYGLQLNPTGLVAVVRPMRRIGYKFDYAVSGANCLESGIS